MTVNPTPQRRHAAARSRAVTALLSAGGFLGIIGYLAASRTAGSASTTTVPPTIPAAPAPAPTASPTPTDPTTNNAPNNAPDNPPDNRWFYGGVPARSFGQPPVTRSHASH